MEKVLTRNIGVNPVPTDMAAYEANGGYRGLRKAMASMSPADCLQVFPSPDRPSRYGRFRWSPTRACAVAAAPASPPA